MAGYSSGGLLSDCCMVSKGMEWMTHSWIQAAHNFPGAVSGSEDTERDETWNLASSQEAQRRVDVYHRLSETVIAL